MAGTTELSVSGVPVTSSAPLPVVSAAGATNIAKDEDAAHASGDTGVPALAVRRDAAAVGSGADGDYSTINVNASGRLYTSATVDAALPTGTNTIGFTSPAAATTGGYSFLNIAAGQATTTVKSGAGTLRAIVFNSAATATNTTTVYDNTAASGTVIAIPDVTTIDAPTTVIFDIAFATGLTVITATANGGNMTFVYK